MRSTLVTALAACAENPLKPEARRFLLGLSCDELQFIAEFLGACILESSERCCCSRRQFAEHIAKLPQARQASSSRRCEDRDHKMILLREYLCRSGLERGSAPARARHA